VDINWGVEEKSADQLELSADGVGDRVDRTVGVTFNNFSMKNIFSKKAWDLYRAVMGRSSVSVSIMVRPTSPITLL